MTQGRTLRIVGAIGLLAGGLISGVVLVVQFAVLSNLVGGASFGATLTMATRLASGFGTVGSVLLVAAFVILAVARGRSGVSARSGLPVVGFIVLAVVFALAELFFAFAAMLFGSAAINLMVPANRVVNVLLIAALVFAALAVLTRGELGGFARYALLLPALVLVVLQLSFFIPYPGYLLAQAVFDLAWIVVGISYLLARPRTNDVATS